MKRWPLRYQLWMLLLVVVVPLVGMLTHTTLREAGVSGERIREQNLSLARLLGETIQSFVQEQEEHLHALSVRPGIQQMDGTACDPILLDFPILHPIYYGLSVLDLEGNMICSSRPEMVRNGVSMADLPLFQTFQRTRTYVVGDIGEIPPTGEKAVGQFYPIYSPTGELVGALGAPILLRRFGEVVENSYLPPATVVTLVHENGTVLARSQDNEQWRGTDVSQLSMLHTATTMSAGWAQGFGVGNVERIYGYSQVEGTPWYLYVGTSIDFVYASARQLLIYNLSWGGLLIALVFAFALMIKRNIEQPISALASTVRAIARGNRNTRAVVGGPKEIAEVAASFNAMLYTLETTDTVLHESEERFRRVLENSQDAMYRLDLQSLRYDYLSPVIKSILGYEVDAVSSILETERADHLHPEDREQVLSAFSSSLHAGKSVHYLEYRCIHKDGHTIWIGDKFSVQHDGEGTPRYVVGTLRDISAQKAAAEALRGYEERLRVIIDASPDLIILVDEDGENLEILTQSADVLTAPVNTVNGKSLAELFNEAETLFFTKIIERALSSPVTQTIEFPMDVEHRRFWLEARSAQLGLHQNGKRLLLFIIRDITERREAEEELRKFTRAIEQSPASVVITDVDGNIQYVNPKFCQVTGYTKDEVIGENPRVLKSGYQSTEYYSDLWQQIASGYEWRGELCNRKKSGEVFWEHASISPIKNDDGVTTHYLAIKEDISERKRIEDQLRQQDRLAAVGQLAAGIAHDFNNIMSAIILYARMLQQHATLTEKEKARLDVINDQAQHAVNLIRQILDFSRRSLVERGPVDLVPFFKEMIKLWERTLPENIQVEFAYDAHEYIVEADPTRLQQAMLNLALNSRDAMTDGGVLRIALQALHIAPEETPPIPGMQSGHWLCITCEDNGNGIPLETLPHIFDPFFTTKDPGKGTGLGLAQVYGIVGQHDGFIDVQSELGEGVTFRIYLPLQSKMERVLMTEITQSPRTGNEMILLVEDNNVSRGAIEDILDLQGYRVLCAHNGSEALAIYRERKAEIDLVLSDMIMPEMSGQQLYHALKSVDPSVKMVLMTGYPLEEEGRKLLEQGLFAWLQKPFTIDALSDVLKTALDQPQTIQV